MMKAPWKVRRMCHQMMLRQMKRYLDLLPHEDEEGVVDVDCRRFRASVLHFLLHSSERFYP